MPFDHYFEYVNSTQAAKADNPLYLFETLLSDGEGGGSSSSSSNDGEEEHGGGGGGGGNSAIHAALLADFTPFPYFDDDLLSVAPDARPGYRWFIAGAPRSGTNIHQDPFVRLDES